MLYNISGFILFLQFKKYQFDEIRRPLQSIY